MVESAWKWVDHLLVLGWQLEFFHNGSLGAGTRTYDRKTSGGALHYMVESSCTANNGFRGRSAILR